MTAAADWLAAHPWVALVVAALVGALLGTLCFGTAR